MATLKPYNLQPHNLNYENPYPWRRKDGFFLR